MNHATVLEPSMQRSGLGSTITPVLSGTASLFIYALDVMQQVRSLSRRETSRLGQLILVKRITRSRFLATNVVQGWSASAQLVQVQMAGLRRARRAHQGNVAPSLVGMFARMIHVHNRMVKLSSRSAARSKFVSKAVVQRLSALPTVNQPVVVRLR
jgi:hypothetical protein